MNEGTCMRGHVGEEHVYEEGTCININDMNQNYIQKVFGELRLSLPVSHTLDIFMLHYDIQDSVLYQMVCIGTNLLLLQGWQYVGCIAIKQKNRIYSKSSSLMFIAESVK